MPAPVLEADFTIQDGHVATECVELGTNLWTLSGSGKIWFDTTLDLIIAFRPLSGLGKIPVLEYVSKVTDTVRPAGCARENLPVPRDSRRWLNGCNARSAGTCVTRHRRRGLGPAGFARGDSEKPATTYLRRTPCMKSW